VQKKHAYSTSETGLGSCWQNRKADKLLIGGRSWEGSVLAPGFTWSGEVAADVDGGEIGMSGLSVGFYDCEVGGIDGRPILGIGGMVGMCDIGVVGGVVDSV
jgi:hypothetical protein